MKKLPDPPAPDDLDEDDGPPPGKHWIRFDFPPGSTPEQIAKILMNWKAEHADDGEPDA